jgi:hypothetical protein
MDTKFYRNVNNDYRYRYTYVGQNNASFSDEDLVDVDGSGFLQVLPNNTDTIPAGIVIAPHDGLDMDSDNQTSAKERPQFIPAEDGPLFMMQTDGNAATVDGQYQIEGGSGSQKVDVSTGTTTGGPVIVRRTEGDDLDGDEVIVELRQT